VDQRPVPAQDLAMRREVELLPAKPGTGKGRRVLRIGCRSRVPAAGGELGQTPTARRLRDLGILVVGEEWERCARAPLLAHEEQGDEGRGQHERGTDLDSIGPDQRRDATALSPIADLVVVLEVAAKAGGRQAGRRPSVAAPSKGGVTAVEDVALAECPGQVLEAPEILVIAGALTSEQGVQGVVEVVAPLGV